jgi:S1-C subfamily serine protease
LRKAAVLIGAFLLCSVTILAGENENFEKDFEKEFKIIVGQDNNGGYLGVYLRDLQPGDVEELGLPAEKGVFLTEITEESPAEKSGLMKGDVIVEYQSMPVLSVKQFQRMVGDTPQGRNVNISLYRDKKKMNLTAEIGSDESSIHRIRKFNMPAPAPADKDQIYRFYQGFADGFSDGLRDHLPGNTQYLLRKGLVLGIEGAAMTEQMADYMGIDESEGVLVTAVSRDSAAEVAGIMAGDVIIAVNGDKVRDSRELRNSLEKGTLELELVRDRKKISLEAEITPPKAPKVRKEKLRM